MRSRAQQQPAVHDGCHILLLLRVTARQDKEPGPRRRETKGKGKAASRGGSMSILSKPSSSSDPPARPKERREESPRRSRPMEQLRQVGEALGGIHALMAFADDNLRINPRQCRLLADACALAFAAVAAEVRAHLRFEDRHARWRPLDAPLRELHRAVRDAEAYVRHCLDPRDSWWARAAAATHGAECVEQHMHALLWSVAVVLEAVEAVAESAASDDPDELARRRLLFSKDYDRDTLEEPRLFRHRLGARYLATRELAARMDAAPREDRWLLSQLLEERRGGGGLTRHEHRLAELLAAPRGKVHPASVLLQGGDFQVRRRIAGSLKEAQWMGEALAVRHLVGADAEAAAAEAALLTSVAHPNVAHCRFCFHDEERREWYLLMDQLMTKDLAAHLKEAKRRGPLPLLVVVDVMLQIARGMEFLHSRKVYHGDLNPSNVLVRTRHADAHLHVKVAGFGQQVGAASPRPSPRAAATTNSNNNPCIWFAPEVLEQEAASGRCTEKADVYSFAMVCFELLTGKIPFEDNHLQGEHMSKNIRNGERPLFPFQAPKYLTSLTKRCWHADPAQRPAFASICRVLRYVKRFLVMNPADPQQAQPEAPPPPVPPVDYLDVEANLLRRFPAWQQAAPPRVADVPFQMFAYRVMERERTRSVFLHISRDKASDSSSDGNSLCGDESSSGFTADGESLSVSSRGTTRSLPDRIGGSGSGSRRASPRKPDAKVTFTSRLAGPPHKSKSMGVVRPPQIARRTQRIKSEGHLNSAGAVPSPRRRISGGGGHASDSELH